MDDDVSVDDATLRRMCHLFSHDLRNPLAAIVTNLEFAKRMLDDVDEDLAEAVRDSVVACEVLRRIVANFDLISSADGGGGSLHEVVLENVVHEVVRKATEQAQQAELTIAVRGADGRTALRLDQVLCSLAVENMLANSLQHAPPNTEVEVIVAAAGDTVTVSVEDRGKPVDEPLRAQACHPELHTMRSRQPGMRYGRGLGLLAARLAAQANGARLELGEHEGRHRVTMTLPTP